MKKLLFLFAIAAFACKAIASEKGSSTDIKESSPIASENPPINTPQPNTF